MEYTTQGMKYDSDVQLRTLLQIWDTQRTS